MAQRQMELFDDATKEEVVLVMKNIGQEVISCARRILFYGDQPSSEEVEELAHHVEELVGAHGHIRRLWEIPQRLPLVELVATQQNRATRWALLALDKLDDLCDELDYHPLDISLDMVEEIYYAARRAVEAANNL